MRKILVTLLLLTAVGLIAQEKAMVTEISGKVEVKRPGEGWTPAVMAQEIRSGDTISTGFNSFLVLELSNSRIQMKPLSRLTLDELVKSEGTTKTAVSLRVGRVRVQVDKAEGLSHDFKVKTPVSTAAVRGTEFDFDGLRLTVRNGLVAFSNSQGQRRSVAGGESSALSGTSAPVAPEEEALAETATVITTTASEAPAAGGEKKQSSGGSIVVTIN